MLSILISWQLILIRALPTPWHHCLWWEKARQGDGLYWKSFCLLSLPSLSHTASRVNDKSSRIYIHWSLPFTWLDIFQNIPSSWKLKDWFHSPACCQFFNFYKTWREAKSCCELSAELRSDQNKDFNERTERYRLEYRFLPQRPCELQILGSNKNSKINQMSLLAFSPHLWLEAWEHGLTD